MVDVQPFKGIHYNIKKVDISKVTAPPYDIISPELQDELYNRDTHNLVRLTLGKTTPKDDSTHNQYTRAATLFQEYLKKKVLLQDDQPAIYPYQVDYTHEKKKKTLTGFFAILKIDIQYDMVKAHEHTLAKPKEDRLKLMRTCQANLEPIELLFHDEKNYIDNLISHAQESFTPTMETHSWNGVNRCWRVTGDIAKKVCDSFMDKKVYIADGHHRYQTAINYFMENKKAQYRLALFVDMDNSGLTILPTHRLIYGMDHLDIKKLLSRAEEFFSIEEKKAGTGMSIMGMIKNKKHVFALYSDKVYLLTLKDELAEREDNKHSKKWYNLDVAILQEILLKKVMDIRLDLLENHVQYTRFEKEARHLVDTGKYQFAILLNPVEMSDLKALALRGEYLPQKSTYFLPKILSGLVMYAF